MRFGCKQGCAVGLLVIIGAAGYFVWSWQTRTQPRLGEDFTRLTPAQKSQRRAEAQQLEGQVRDLAEAAKRHERKPFSIQVSEAQLNTLLQDRLDTSKFPIRQLRAGLSPDLLSLQGRILYKGFDVTVTLQGNITVTGNRLQFKSDSLSVDGFPVGSLKQKIDREVTQALNRLLQEAPGRVENVTIGDGKMTISGVTN
jgi:HAMP domain-containing protein